VVSQYDSQIGYGKEWLAKVKATYLEKKGIKDLTAQGYTDFRREEIKNASGPPDVRITATPPPAYTQAQQLGSAGANTMAKPTIVMHDPRRWFRI